MKDMNDLLKVKSRKLNVNDQWRSQPWAIGQLPNTLKFIAQ
jgi:hypothetical protein